jgi:predicted amidohydrolase
MNEQTLTLALIHDVFPGAEQEERLVAVLRDAARRGAELAVLPELGVDPWIPATRDVRDNDCEAPGGPRQQRLSRAAAAAEIAVLGGAIVRDPATNERRNRAFVHDGRGQEIACYDKLHLPCEPGFWESDHYAPGDDMPQVIDALGFPFGIQICSDLNRPAACQQLAYRGAAAILSMRATPPASFDRWRTVIRANAIFACAYVVSVNRPRSEGGADIGGSSLAFAPGGATVAETTDPVSVITLHRETVQTARRDYPGYLDVRTDLYARGWREAGRRRP